MVIKMRIFCLFMNSSRIRLLMVVLLTVCCVGACKQAGLRDDADLDTSIRRLSQLLEEFYKIPVYTQNFGDRSFIAWKDQGKLTSFYETYRNDFSIMNNVFSMNAKTTGIWSDDAAFSRGVLYCLLTQVAPNPLTQEGALAVWNEFLHLGSAIHIEESTKTAMGDAFINKLEILTPSLSYEENLQVIFRAYRTLSLIRLKEYQKAIKENELIMQTYPTSKYAQEIAQDQIRAIRDVMEGKMSPPERLPERWQGHSVK